VATAQDGKGRSREGHYQSLEEGGGAGNPGAVLKKVKGTDPGSLGYRRWKRVLSKGNIRSSMSYKRGREKERRKDSFP